MKRLLCLLVLCSGMVSPAWSAVVCGDAQEYNSTTPTDPRTSSYTTPAGSNQVLFALSTIRTTTVTIDSATHAGNAMTAFPAGSAFISPIRTLGFYIVNPTSGTNDVVVQYSAAPLADALVVFTCSGVNTASPIHDSTNGTGTGTAVTVTVPNVVVGDVVIDMMATDVATTDPTEGENQTVLHKGNDGVELGWGSSQQPGADGGVMTWTTTLSQEWAIQAVAVSPAAGGMKARKPVSF